MQKHQCDVAIIGAGTAGLAAERAARQDGATTLLIDPYFAGTVCATVGCMPSKLLIAAAASAHAARRADVFGVKVPEIVVNGPAVMQRLRAQRDAFVTATQASMANIPDGICVQAKARFDAPGRLVLDNGSTVDARAIVLATGSFPMIPAPFSDLGDVVLTNRTLFDLADLPESLAVVGGGAIGLEIAQAMARLGVKVALFDRGSTLGGAQNGDIQSAIVDAMGKEMTLHMGVDVTASRNGDGVILEWSGDSNGTQRFARVLVATGRPPQLDGLGLDASGLALDDHGVPCFDRETLQCGDAPVFIAGDSNSDAPILHEASIEGAIAGQNAALFPAMERAARNPRFSITFTDPPLAILGDAPGKDSVTGCADYTDQGRAKVEARALGAARLFADRQDGRLTGAEMFAPGADHLAHLLVWAIKRGDTATALLDMPFYHPTLEEGLKPALRQICANCGIEPPEHTDSGNPSGA
jgi:dihydrolipoamide dehydrogenase